MIGFIGVGTMGEPMCRNLARKSGATVLAADRNPEPLQRLAADGVKTASMDEIVASCRTIFLSLPGGKEVEQVCLGAGGILSKVQMGWTIVDTSTAPVALARRLYAEFEGKACAFADAPIARTR
ncbi:MAG TPA: NAD(P)-binding domain-containing protein, partial [Reyranella sp.]|nr:NAD(P)-binding domain-containing protein [Reyranella sp.]